jgi:outer membrane protein insertion porin family
VTTLASLARCLFAAALLWACAALPSDPGEVQPMAFPGADTLGKDRLRRLVAEEVGESIAEGWTRSAVDDAAFAIEREYAREGFAFARVEHELVEEPAAQDRAVFHIEEGPRVALESLRFEGAESLRLELLSGFFPALPRGALLRPGDAPPARRRGTPPWWIESELLDAAEDLEDYYYKNGFLDARVEPPRVTLDPQRRGAQVLVVVDEGVRARFAQVDLEGAPPEALSDLRRAADSFLGAPYSRLAAGALRARLEDELARRGFPDAVVKQTDETRSPEGPVAVAISIVSGPRIRIAAVEIRGLERTRRSTVEDLLTLQPGDWYSSDRERESFRALYQSGLFSGVQVELVPGIDAARVLRVEVQEADSLELYAEPGYGSYERLRVGLGARYKNLFGTGRTVELAGTLAELAQSGRASLITPRFLGTDVRSTVSVLTSRRREPTFTVRETGATWLLWRRFQKELAATLGYAFSATSVSNVDVVGPQVQALIDAVETSSVSLTPVWDTRDSVFVPTRGSVSRVTAEYADAALGSELEFLRLRLSHSTYFDVWNGGVLALSWRGGWIMPVDSTTSIPLQERFFNGGENTVRSFREDQLGPTDPAGNPVGGEAYHVLSAELRHKLRGNLDGALFYDTGTVQLDHQDFFDLTGFRTGVGLGLRYVLPIGPIRLDYGVNPDPRGGEVSYVLHFAVGLSF